MVNCMITADVTKFTNTARGITAFHVPATDAKIGTSIPPANNAIDITNIVRYTRLMPRANASRITSPL
jgi:hypothetical protein